MEALLIALSALFAQPSVAVVGDSVIITVSVAANATPQTVAVDSVGIRIDRVNCISCDRAVTVAPGAGVTTARFAYPLSMWAPNQTWSGKIGARLAHVEEGLVAWSAWTDKSSGWTYTRTVPAPAAPEAAALSAQSALN